jgi:predicted nuclease of predicted toxin-antitoxin system
VLVVATGNITNDALLSLFELHLDAIVSALDEADFVEVSQDVLALGRSRVDSES